MLFDNFSFDKILVPRLTQALALAVRKMAANEPWVAMSAAPHAGKTIAVNLTVLGRELKLSWLVDANEILIAQELHMPATVELTVAPTVYASLAHLPFDMQRVMRHVQISGDAHLAEWVNRLAQQLRPDVWEDLSKIIGDVPSQYAQLGAQKIFNHFKKTVAAVTQQAQYVMLDETPVFVRHAALEEFAADAQELRYAADRLSQRIENLQRLRGSKQ